MEHVRVVLVDAIFENWAVETLFIFTPSPLSACDLHLRRRGASIAKLERDGRLERGKGRTAKKTGPYITPNPPPQPLPNSAAHWLSSRTVNSIPLSHHRHHHIHPPAGRSIGSGHPDLSVFLDNRYIPTHHIYKFFDLLVFWSCSTPSYTYSGGYCMHTYTHTSGAGKEKGKLACWVAYVCWEYTIHDD